VSATHGGDEQRLTWQARFDDAVRGTAVCRASDLLPFIDFARLWVKEFNDCVSLLTTVRRYLDAWNKAIPAVAVPLPVAQSGLGIV
jgi:hypothetical protein